MVVSAGPWSSGPGRSLVRANIEFGNLVDILKNFPCCNRVMRKTWCVKVVSPLQLSLWLESPAWRSQSFSPSQWVTSSWRASECPIYSQRNCWTAPEILGEASPGSSHAWKHVSFEPTTNVCFTINCQFLCAVPSQRDLAADIKHSEMAVDEMDQALMIVRLINWALELSKYPNFGQFRKLVRFCTWNLDGVLICTLICFTVDCNFILLFQGNSRRYAQRQTDPNHR